LNLRYVLCMVVLLLSVFEPVICIMYGGVIIECV